VEERNAADLDRGGVDADVLRGVHVDALRDFRDVQIDVPRAPQYILVPRDGSQGPVRQSDEPAVDCVWTLRRKMVHVAHHVFAVYRYDTLKDVSRR